MRVPVPERGSIGDSPYCYRYVLPGDAGCSSSDLSLIASIERYGVITPPLVTIDGRSGKIAEIILGHRRLAASGAAGLKEAEALTAGGGQAEHLGIWLEEAPGGAPLSELEKILITRKAIDLASGETGRILPRLSDITGRNLTAEFAGKLTGLLETEKTVLDALHGDRISAGDLLLLESSKTLDVEAAVRLLSFSEMSRGSRKEALRLLLYLADQGEERLGDFISNHQTSRGPLLEALRAACYPALSRDIEEIGELVTSMGLPPGVTLNPPENMEGGSCLLSIRVRDEEALKIALNKVEDAVKRGKFLRLLEIIRGGCAWG